MAAFEPEPGNSKEVEIIDADEYQMDKTFAPAVYQSSATLLNSLFFPPYEIVRSDDSDDNLNSTNNNKNEYTDDHEDANADDHEINSSIYLQKCGHLNNPNAPNNYSA